MSDLSRLQTIAILFPHKQATERQFFMQLLGLLISVPGATTNEGALFFMPSAPEDALPYSMMQQADVPFPCVLLDTTWLVYAEAGRFAFTTIPPQLLDAVVLPESKSAKKFPGTPPLLPMADIIMRLHGRLQRLDHLGVNMPAQQISRDDWDTQLNRLTNAANMYRYPTGEDWCFIVPSTEQEFVSEIKEFPAGRAPKFELVYDAETTQPILQIDLQTDMDRAELESLFPAPHGIALPGVGDYFRSVFVEHPWPGLLLRFDLRYKNDGPPTTWDTGEWLVADGVRMRPE